MFNIAVIGAGVVGLSTAVNLQNSFGDKCHVTLIADKFFEETTSYGAAGIFKPPVQLISGTSEQTARKWISSGWNHYSALASGPDADESGILITSGYMYFSQPRPRPAFADYVYEFHECSEKELSIYPGGPYKYGWHVRTVLIECRKYLPYLMNSFRKNGGVVINKRIQNLEDVAMQYDLLVNCSGLGSRDLFQDEEVFPIRGHLIRVKTPWIQNFVETEDHCHIFPARDSAVLGGTRQENDMDETARKEDRDKILQRMGKVIPSLKGAEITEEWVGLRPGRSKVRVELERRYIKGRRKPIWVAHNYGHGAVGVAISWGTAISVCDLIRDRLSSRLSAKL